MFCSVLVSETEDHNEALSISNEAELSNNLPGDDLDECLLYGGELCQHLCINTVGSYKCSCFPEFTLQEDGTSCSPGEEREQETLWIMVAFCCLYWSAKLSFLIFFVDGEVFTRDIFPGNCAGWRCQEKQHPGKLRLCFIFGVSVA